MKSTWIRTLTGTLLFASTLALGACSSPDRGFVPPQQRTLSPTQKPWPDNHVLILAYHDVQDYDPDQTFIAVHTHHLVQHFAWLRENGYQPVSVDQILQARKGGPALPEKAVLLTFDDGYSSFQTRVLPLLKAYKWPAVLAPVGVWADTPANETINFGGKPVRRAHFLDWAAIRDIHASGLVEIASHSNNLHFGLQANPQGNTQPAAATRIYDPATGRYETDQAYAKRIQADAQTISAKIQRVTGKKPRVWIWPYGEANGLAIKQLEQQGYELIMTLDWGLADISRPLNMPRLLVSDDPDLPAFSNTSLAMEESNLVRAVHVQLDEVYDSNPDKSAQRLGALVQRIADLKVNTVFLTAYADPDNNGRIDALYFPNRHLAMRDDLFNRVAWQLRTRAGVSVYATMPVDAVTQFSEPLSEQQISDIYEDLARYNNFAGVLFISSGPAGNQHFYSAPSLSFANTLAERVRALRGPQVRTAQQISVATWEHAATGATTGELLATLEGHDWIVMELADHSNADNITLAQHKDLLRDIGQHPEILAKTVFMLKTPRSVSSSFQPGSPEEASARTARQLVQLQILGAASVGYLNDDFLNDQPRLETIRPALSTAWYPYK